MASATIASIILTVLPVIQVAASRDLLQYSCGDDSCIPEFGKCGGTYFNVSSGCCDEDKSCVVKNFFYAQCLTEEKAAINIANGWDGSILDCEEMPEDVIGGPMDIPDARKLLDMEGGYGDMDCEDDSCEWGFEKCGGGYNTSTTCCDPQHSCVVKNWYYAQCLTEERAALNVATQGWDGRVLVCEKMPWDAPKGPMTDAWDFNKTEEDVEYVVSRKLQGSMEMDCEDDTCVDTFEKCGGTNFTTSVPCCVPEAECIVKNYWYAQCLTHEHAKMRMKMYDWVGKTLYCEEMPEELMPKDDDEDYEEEGMYGGGRRMLATGYGMGYGSKGGYGAGLPSGSYGFSMEEMDAPAHAPMEMPKEMPSEMPATAPVTPATEIIESDLVLGEGCDNCAPVFGQCADKGDVVSCCGEGLQCTKKHGFYAQCLPPARATRNVENFGWDGAVLECGTVML